MKKNFRLLLCALFVLFALCLGACGNKGDLYMPKEAATSTQVEKEAGELKKAKIIEAETDNETGTETKEDGVS